MKTKNIMIISISMIFLIGIGFVIAGGSIGLSFSDSTTLDKASVDYIKTKLPAEQQKSGEIKPQITLECLEKTCEWSAVLPNIIQSYDNPIDRCYQRCDKWFNESENNCGDWVEVCHTEAEMQVIVSDIVNSRIGGVAQEGMNKASSPIPSITKGEIIITEKR